MSRESKLRRIFRIGKGFGMIAFRKRPERSLKPISKEMERRTYPWLVMQRREKERVPRVTMRGQPRSRVRRKT